MMDQGKEGTSNGTSDVDAILKEYTKEANGNPATTAGLIANKIFLSDNSGQPVDENLLKAFQKAYLLAVKKTSFGANSGIEMCNETMGVNRMYEKLFVWSTQPPKERPKIQLQSLITRYNRPESLTERHA